MPPSVPKVFIEYIINILRNLVNIYIQGQKKLFDVYSGVLGRSASVFWGK